MLTITGKHGIFATVLKDSQSPGGVRLITFELTYPRIILAELNTHRMFSRNSSSSRAIPFAKMATQLTARPVRFGQANPGMQDKGEDYRALVDMGPFLGFSHDYTVSPEMAWGIVRDKLVQGSQAFFEAGYHKQVYNRLTEPFQMMKTVLSATEFGNFDWLRNHEAADPSLHELARVMNEAASQSMPTPLNPGEWHLPYIETVRVNGEMRYYINEEFEDGECYARWLDVETAKQVSAARSAAVSFRNIDYGVGKSSEVFKRLVGDDRKHASAFEHQATPMQPEGKDGKFGGFDVNLPYHPSTWEPGVSHMDADYNLWSGNLRGWIQFRKLIPGENHE